MAYMRIMVLVWADVLAAYSVWALVTYLVDVWGLSITYSAAVVNIWMGIGFTMQTVAYYLVDTLTGHFSMLLFSSIAYCIGLGFLAMSTPPVLSSSTGTCSEYKPECIGHTQKVLFYTALPLMAVGLSGHNVSLVQLMAEQRLKTDMRRCGLRIVGGIGVFLVPIVGAIALPLIKPWSIRFGIPAICVVVATLVFLSSSCTYTIRGPQGSPLTSIFRVIFASISKMMWKLPSEPKELYEKDDPDLVYLPHTRGLRWFDKAAIKLPRNQEQEAETNRWRLSRITEVEQTKILIRLLPMWTTLIICGVVSSIGNSYFAEQANRMNPKVGNWKVPLQVFQLIFELAKEFIFVVWFETLTTMTRLRFRKYTPVISMAVAMIFAILCCITAAKVEARRLHVIQTHDLLDKPDERIPMTMFWLVPQFLLLGGLDTFFSSSVELFLKDQIPQFMLTSFSHFTYGLYGLGYLSSVLSVFVVGKISERGGNSNWFQHTLNRSRLDNYYWTLAGISAVSLVSFILAAICYSYKEPSSGDESGNLEEKARFCCFVATHTVRTAPGEYFEEASDGWECCLFNCKSTETTVQTAPRGHYQQTSDSCECCCFYSSRFNGVEVTNSAF